VGTQFPGAKKLIIVIIAVTSYLSDRWVRAPKCLRHVMSEGVAALNCHRKTLTKKRCWTWFVGHSCQSAADFHAEVTGLLASGSRCFNCNTDEIDAGCDVSVLIIIIICLPRRIVSRLNYNRQLIQKTYQFINVVNGVSHSQKTAIICFSFDSVV